jgi:acetyltransferase-like isoleucine patch superfamily enzyme
MIETTSYQILKKLRILKNEKYSNVSLWKAIFIIPKRILDLLLYGYSYSFMLLEPLNYSFLRAKCWRFIGCNMGKNIGIGRHCDFDYGNAEKITIEDNVLIAHGCSFLCHKRDNSKNYVGKNPHTLPYIIEEITLKTNCQIGTNVMIMPGVTIGEGAVIGAASVVTKDIPAWSIAIGNPAKVVKQIKQKEDENTASNQ